MARRHIPPGELPFPQWGGARRGAGRKPKGPRALAPRERRPDVARRFPVHVTTHVCPGLPSLRQTAERQVLLDVFALAAERFGFRLVHFSIQSNHLHLIAEVEDRHALVRGARGLLIRAAHALNRHWDRRGRVFEDRYHVHVLRTPREARNALAYVLNNARKHGWSFCGPDPYGSGAQLVDVAAARTWLLTEGLRRAGR